MQVTPQRTASMAAVSWRDHFAVETAVERHQTS
jgi:hypothetical protein